MWRVWQSRHFSSVEAIDYDLTLENSGDAINLRLGRTRSKQSTEFSCGGAPNLSFESVFNCSRSLSELRLCADGRKIVPGWGLTERDLALDVYQTHFTKVLQVFRGEFRYFVNFIIFPADVFSHLQTCRKIAWLRFLQKMFPKKINLNSVDLFFQGCTPRTTRFKP